MFRPRLLLANSALMAGLAATACHTAPAPLDPTPVVPQVAYRLLTPTTTNGTTPPPAACTVTVAIHRLRTPPPGVSADLAASAIRSERGAPFRGASTLSADTLWAHGEALAPWLAAAADRERTGDELPVGTANAVVAAPLVTDVQWAEGAPTLRLLATAAGVAVRIVPGGAADAPRQELALADALPADDRAVLFVPDAPASPRGTAVLLQVGGPAGDDAVAAALAAAPALATMPDAPPVGQFAFAAVGEHNRRPALLAVARSSGLPRCIDLLLAADERALIEATAALAALTTEERSLPHRVEGALLGSLLPRLDRDDLPPGLLAALRRQLGARCDDTAELRRMLQQSADGDAFARALRDENLAALDDRSAAVRVRAHDWLTTHGGALEGFDPLGPAKERRAVLRRSLLQGDNTAADAGRAPQGGGR
ncbi:MAG: hypothetical protein ACK501_16395 [Planctomycetota bacterium]